MRALEAPKAAPEDGVRQSFAAIEAGELEVRVDEAARQVKAALSQGVYLGDALGG